MKYELDELVAVAKRDQNKLRPYLYVNPLQGKHVPVQPSQALQLYQELASLVTKQCEKEKLLVIGFAETATAIGAGVAMYCDQVVYCSQTTRETRENAQYLYFTESHSHAKEQSLLINQYEEIIHQVDRIVFAEDEVTTGNTILKLIHAIRTQFPNSPIKFTIACILNSMQDTRIEELAKDGIDCVYLSRLPYEYRIESIDSYDCSGNTDYKQTKQQAIPVINIGQYADLRLLQQKESYLQACDSFVKQVMESIRIDEAKSILVLGSEEFMMPPMLVAQAIEKHDPTIQVRCHATTRSPILVSQDEHYPLHSRYQIESMYEKGRITYIYNLTQYDEVLIISDAQDNVQNGMRDLRDALQSAGCKKITFVQWSNV